jgi:3-hydroxyacyl-[acyl-carrier-protein] dehydratase
VPQQDAFLDPTRYDTSACMFGVEDVRRTIPHRHEMEQLSGVLEVREGWIVGYTAYGPDAFWVRGHIPGSPVLPGVLMIEAAAQLGTFYCHHIHPERVGFWALAAVDAVRFRGVVRPGDTLLLANRLVAMRARLIRYDFQGYVGTERVVEGRITGVLLPADDEG